MDLPGGLTGIQANIPLTHLHRLVQDRAPGLSETRGVGADGQPWVVNKQGAVFARVKGHTSYVDGTWKTIGQNGTATTIGVGEGG